MVLPAATVRSARRMRLLREPYVQCHITSVLLPLATQSAICFASSSKLLFPFWKQPAACPHKAATGSFICGYGYCSFCLWEDNKFFSTKKKKLTKKIAKELLDKGWCRVTGLYTPKKPQLYDAVIRLDDSGGKYVSFKMEFDR